MKKLLGILLAVSMVFAVAGQAMAYFERGNLLTVFYVEGDVEVAIDQGVFTNYEAFQVDTSILLPYFAAGTSYEDIQVGIYAQKGHSTYSNHFATTVDDPPGISIPSLSSFTDASYGSYVRYCGFDPLDGATDGIVVEVEGSFGGYTTVMNSNGHQPGYYAGLNQSYNVGETTLDENGDFSMYLHNYEMLTYAGRTVISTVPVPAAVWLLGSGLLGLIGVRRKKA